jgi:transcriptional regulator with XRE-family HTH domain
MTLEPHPGAREAPGEPIGAMLTRLRLARGLSQLRLAELLCAAAGTPTVSRHEVSRWEREERVPGPFWRGWLAMVFDIPLEVLESAATVSRHATGPATGEPRLLWRPPTVADLLDTLDRAGADEVRLLAHAWLAGPPGHRPPAPATRQPATPAADDPPGPARLQALRQMDDLVGGADLAATVDRELRAVITAWPGATAGRDALRLVAGWAQLAGWVHADAGQPRRAHRAWSVGLRAAAAAGDRPLAGHLLGSVSHHHLAAGRPQEALLLARTAYSGARSPASARCRALLLHRVALAAAGVDERRAAHAALVRADRAAERATAPDREPDWLYWVDGAELAAMTGRCLVALGRPMRAAPLLLGALSCRAPRSRAVYAGWLARAYLDLGEVEQACEVAADAWMAAIRAGSARAADGLRQLHPLLVRYRDVPAVRGYQRLATAAADYVPGGDAPAHHRARAAAGRR